MLWKEAPLSSASDPTFLAEWNALPRKDRLRMVRAVRWGRGTDTPDRAITARYARFQSERLWMRRFWWWFVPALLLCLTVAAQIHPVVVGAVLAAGAQAVMKRRNLARCAAAQEDLRTT
jgi:hypothetical protein